MMLILTPADRHALFTHVHHKSRALKDGQAGRRARRFMRTLGLDVIRETMRDHQNLVSERYSRDVATMHAFAVTDETLDELAELEKVERPPAMEFQIGHIFDRIPDLRRGVPTQGSAPPYEDDRSAWAPEDTDIETALARILIEATGGDRDRAIAVCHKVLSELDAVSTR